MTIVFCVTGSIAAYKALPLITTLRQQDHVVHVIMTDSATKLVDPKEFALASGHPVRLDMFDPEVDYRAYLSLDKKIDHISLADIADVYVVCPASANTIGKIASGIADNLVTSSIMATGAQVIVAPAMNVKMWQNPIHQKNIHYLRTLGYLFVDPEYGELACGYTGVGRLASGDKVLQMIDEVLEKRMLLKGKKIIVTSGGTQEPIDEVRVISNRASGKMGAALADISTVWGASVIYIHGLHAVLPTRLTKNIPVEKASDMFIAIKQEIVDADIIFHTAAVSDFSLKEPMKGKIKSDHELALELTPQTKILNQLKQLNPKGLTVGFKAEYNVNAEKLIESAFKTLKESNADYIIANDVGKAGRGFGTDTNEVWIVDREKKITHIPLSSKQEISKKIIEKITNRAYKQPKLTSGVGNTVRTI